MTHFPKKGQVLLDDHCSSKTMTVAESVCEMKWSEEMREGV